MFKKFLIFIFSFSIIAMIVASVVAVWGYNYLTRDLPNLDKVKNQPSSVSKVLSSDGRLIAEFFNERRYPVSLDEIPLIVRQAFLAAEDANFYDHPGVDLYGMMRATIKNLMAGAAKQGGSTITQQVVKNVLLTNERKLERKLKEIILSYELEQRLTKDQILELYLNRIFFGNGAYGIKAAVSAYYHKQLSEVTLAEAAMLAGLPKAPSNYSPVSHMDLAKGRQRYVLGQMLKVGFITKAQKQQAESEEIKVYPAVLQNIYHSPYYVSEVRRVLSENWRQLNIDEDGLEIQTALDIDADRLAQKAVRRGLREVDKRRGWRGPIASYPRADLDRFIGKYSARSITELEPGEVYPALVSEIKKGDATVRVNLGHSEVRLDLKQASWAKKRILKGDNISFLKVEDALRVGDVIEVSLPEPLAQEVNADLPNKLEVARVQLDQTPDLESALVLIDPYTGKVPSLIGGYSYQKSVFNRATQAYRQPGSSFKPVVYLAAVDGYGYTPATIVQDSPRTFRVGDQFWTPGNFDSKYLGPIPLRMALEKSRNLVSADIVSHIGVDAVIQYAKRVGIASKLGRNLSLALGSSEVTPLEMTRSYGVFAAKGVLADSTFITKISDRSGAVFYDFESDKLNHAREVIPETSAFIMSHMMKGVIERGTGTRIRPIGRPVAGKTGTSNDQMDAWFIGYTPQWVCGVWVGFDTKKEIGDKETGGVVAAPIWLYFMDPFLKAKDQQNYDKLVIEAKQEAQKYGIEYVAPEAIEPLDFSPPEGVDPYFVDRSSGQLSTAEDSNAVLEYFKKGTEPSANREAEEAAESYLNTPEL